MPKTKAQLINTKKAPSKLSPNLLSRKKFDKPMVIVLAAAIVTICGYLYYQSTQAAALNPYWVTLIQMGIKAGDTTTNKDNSSCFGYLANTGYGASTRCMQVAYNQAKFRVLTYNYSAKVFFPEAWVYGQTTSKIHQGVFTCKNNGYYFTGWGPVMLYTKPIYIGQELRPTLNTPSGWQVRFSNINYESKVCTSTGPWLNIVGKLPQPPV